MIVVEKLINTLKPLVNNKVYRQGSLSENDKYPSIFITYWENESNDKSHYDNVIVNGISHNFDVNVYGSDDDEVYDTLNQIIIELKNNGFIVDGQGIDIPSDEPKYIGRHIDVIYVDYKN